MPDFSAPVAQNVQAPNFASTLSGLMGIQQQGQNLQTSRMQNQQSAIDLQETKNAQGLMSNIKSYQDNQGNIDFTKLIPDMMQAAPKNGSAYLTRIAQMQQAHTDAANSVNTLDANARAQVGSILYSLKGQKPEVASSTLNQLGAAYPSLRPAVGYFQRQIAPALQSGNQPAIDDALDQAGKMIQPTNTQQLMNTPGGETVNDNATTRVVSTKPGTSVPPGQVVPGTQATMQLSPSTPTIGPNGQPGVIGPHASVDAFAGASPTVAPPQGTADFSGVQGPQRLAILQNIARMNPDPAIRQQASQAALAMTQSQLPGQGGSQFPASQSSGAPSGFVPTGLPPGQAANMANNVDEMNRHFAGLQDSASGAQMVQGLTGNIKALATGAATGTESGRKAYVAGLLNALHLGNQATGDLQTDTNLLEKNMAQLSMAAPASTDAARNLVLAARPNSGMSTAAISEAADQVASQVKANMAMRNALQGYKMMGDVQGYANARQRLEQVADPRAWQYEALSPGSPAAKAFVDRLTPADKADLGGKIQQLEQMGMFK